jgi:pyruvate dehydrogenase E2 component (dihydrolipoamide acetyltransferase)
MSRTFRTAMLLAVTVLAGCKARQADPAPAARPTEPARSGASTATPALPDPKPAAPAAPAAPAPAVTPAEAQARGVAAMQHLADTLAADAKDCEKLAVDLKAFIAENKPLLAQLIASANRPGDPQVADRAAAAAAARKLQTAMTTCAANSSVAAAMKDLPGP